MLRSLVVALALVVPSLPFLPAEASTDDPFVYETRAPTPRASASSVWADGNPGHAGYQECGTYPTAFRVSVPSGKIETFLFNLRRNVAPWSGNGSDYRIVLRAGSPTGEIAYETTEHVGRPQIADVSDAITRLRRLLGYVDLYPTIECTGDGWTYWPDTDWGRWDLEAYHVNEDPHAIGADDVSAWYQNGVDRLDDLKKYDLAVLNGVYDDWSDEIAELRGSGTRVAGYVSFGEEYSPDGEPKTGDADGPGGYDSRYVDYEDPEDVDGDGETKEPDGYPDYKGNSSGTKNFFTDPRTDSWQRVVLDEIGRQTEVGTGAVFFDTFSVHHPDLVPGVRSLVRAVRDEHPDMPIVVNSYHWYTEVGDLIGGVMFESFTYGGGCERLNDTDLRARDDQARLANATRRADETPTFDVFTLDYVCPFDASDKIDDAYAQATQSGIAASVWRMLMVNPAIGFTSTTASDGVTLSWSVHDADPHPEEMASVADYEVRRSTEPIVDDADWEDATVVASGLPAGTREVTDDEAPADTTLYYGIRGFRTGDSHRTLLGMPTVEAQGPTTTDDDGGDGGGPPDGRAGGNGGGDDDGKGPPDHTGGGGDDSGGSGGGGDGPGLGP